MWRLADVKNKIVSGLEDKLVCSFKLVTDVVWGGVGYFVYDANRPAFLERDLVGLSVDGNWQVWVHYRGGELVPIHTVGKGSDRFLQCRKHYIQCIVVGKLSSWTYSWHGW